MKKEKNLSQDQDQGQLKIIIIIIEKGEENNNYILNVIFIIINLYKQTYLYSDLFIYIISKKCKFYFCNINLK